MGTGRFVRAVCCPPPLATPKLLSVVCLNPRFTAQQLWANVATPMLYLNEVHCRPTFGLNARLIGEVTVTTLPFSYFGSNLVDYHGVVPGSERSG